RLSRSYFFSQFHQSYCLLEGMLGLESIFLLNSHDSNGIYQRAIRPRMGALERRAPTNLSNILGKRDSENDSNRPQGLQPKTSKAVSVQKKANGDSSIPLLRRYHEGGSEKCYYPQCGRWLVYRGKGIRVRKNFPSKRKLVS